MDVSAQVVEAITAWFKDLAAQLVRPATDALAQLVFQTPRFDTMREVEQTWSIVRASTDGLLMLALVAAGVLVMSSGTFESRYTAKVLVPRVVLAAVAANGSLALCGALIQPDTGLVSSVLGEDAGARVLGTLMSMVMSGEPGQQLVGILVGLTSEGLAMLLVVLYIGRDIVLLLMTVLGPLALATYALPQTDGIARLWVRVFTSLLFVQVAQAVLIAVGTSLLRNTDWLGGPVSELTSGLVLVTLLYLVFKLPFAAYQYSFRQPVEERAVLNTVIVAARAVAARV